MPYFQVMFTISFNRMFMASLLLTFSGLQALLADEMEPSLGLSFPMTAEGEAVVTTKAVLINKQTILPVGSLLRCCFQMPESNSADVKKKEKKNNLENTFSRKPIKVTSKDNDFNPYAEAVKDRAFETVWSNPDLFRGYFHKIDPARYFLVFQKTGTTEPAYAKFFFPEGLFLASDGEQIEVISVQAGSRSQEAGFTAGEKIHTLEGLELNGDLKLFLSHYLSVMKKNKLSGTGLIFDVSAPDQADHFSRTISLPLSIHSDPFGPVVE
jgi:hypothetical protein